MSGQAAPLLFLFLGVAVAVALSLRRDLALAPQRRQERLERQLLEQRRAHVHAAAAALSRVGVQMRGVGEAAQRASAGLAALGEAMRDAGNRRA